MAKFKIGDKVIVHAVNTEDSRRLDGRIGIIIEENHTFRSDFGREVNYYLLDIAKLFISPSHVWEYEIKLVEKKAIKKYGIAIFCEKNYK
jgi:hypothetical protein